MGDKQKCDKTLLTTISKEKESPKKMRKLFWHPISKVLLIGLLHLPVVSSFAQSNYEVSINAFIDSLKQTNSDTIIEIRLNKNNLEHRLNVPSTYVYFKNGSTFCYKFCGKKFDTTSENKTECNNEWQILFDFVADHWANLSREKLFADTILQTNGTIRISSPTHFDSVEILIHTNEKTENLLIRKDFFSPSTNRFYKANILTKVFLYLTLIEKCNDEVDTKKNL